MDIALRIARWLLGISISVALSFWIFFATVNATVANRDVVKNWIASSGAYDKALDSLMKVSVSTKEDPLLREAAQQAFVQTFEGSFVRQGTETALDASYDWLEGKASAITFSIPVQDKKTEFYANMTAALAPKLQALPACPTRIPVNTATLTCLPPGTDAVTYASQLTRPASEDFLNQPLTQDTLGASLGQAPAMPWLPGMVQGLHTSLWMIPLFIVVCAALYVLASPDRLRGVGRVARQLTLGAAIPLVAGVCMWVASSSLDMSGAIEATNPSQAEQQRAIVQNILNPLTRTILPDVAQALTLYSGIVTAIAGATWLGVFIWRHRRSSGGPTPPAYTSGPPVPPPPADGREAQLPPPIARP